MLSGGILQLAGTLWAGGQFVVNAPGYFGYEWAIGPESDGGVALERTDSSGQLWVARGFIGPTIGNSGYRTSGEFADAVWQQYQQFYDAADAVVQQQVASGAIANDPLVVGRQTDALARFSLRTWLSMPRVFKRAPTASFR